MIKQVIVIRHDLKMRQGKAIAQGAHASAAFLTWRILAQDAIPLNDMESEWLSTGTRKICVRVESEEELRNIISKAEASSVMAYPITDTGYTEFHGKPTLTCVALGPDRAEKLDEITGHLKLM